MMLLNRGRHIDLPLQGRLDDQQNLLVSTNLTLPSVDGCKSRHDIDTSGSPTLDQLISQIVRCDEIGAGNKSNKTVLRLAQIQFSGQSLSSKEPVYILCFS